MKYTITIKTPHTDHVEWIIESGIKSWKWNWVRRRAGLDAIFTFDKEEDLVLFALRWA